jgi:hypothetical protein
VDSLRLILLGANAKHPVASEDGRAAVHGAVYYHNAVGLELIFRNSVDSLHVQEQRQWNPLHYAAYQDSVPMVKFILSRGGASLLQSEDVTNMTPLQVAKSYNAESKAAVVLEEYASTHAPKTHHRHTDSVPHEEQKNTHFLEMKSKIQMSGLLKDHRKGLKKFPLSVRGEKLVNWVISAGHAKTKYQAMALCQGIVRYCGLRPCGQPAYDKGQEPNFEFSDDRTLFQFTRQT